MSLLPESDRQIEPGQRAHPEPPTGVLRHTAWRRVGLAIIIWCLLFGLLFASRRYTFSSPIVHDEGVFLYGGMACAAGEVPYRDFWDHKPPGIALFHSIPISLFGYSLLAVRLHEVFWLAVSATVFFYLCRTYLSLGTAVLSVLLYSFFVSVKLVIRSGGLTEESALTFQALSYLFALRERGSLRLSFFLAGLFLGLAAQFRQPTGISVIFIVLCVLWRPRGWAIALRKKLVVLPLLALGAALPEAVCSGYFLLKGMPGEYLEASYLFNFTYMRGTLDPDFLGPGVLWLPTIMLTALPAEIRAGLETHIITAQAVLQKHLQILKATGPHLLSPLFGAALLWWLPVRLRRVVVLLIVAFLCDFEAISLGGRYYEHYYLQAAISSSFLLGLALQGIYEGLRPGFVLRAAAPEMPGAFRRRRTLRVTSLILCVLVGAFVLRIWAVSSAGAVKQYVQNYKAEMRARRQPGRELAEEQAIGEAIRTVTRQDERILLLGASPTSVYFVGQRLAGCRYYHLSPFFRKAFAKSICKRHRDRFMADVQSRRPVLIILAREERQIYFAGMEAVEKSAASFLVPYLDENYVPLEEFYRRPWRREGWWWYRRTCSFLVRKDKTEEVSRRLQRADSAAL